MILNKNKILLSILICSLPKRIESYALLITELNRQLKENDYNLCVEVITLLDCKTYSIGFKRNLLKKLSNGKFLCSIDDDDMISDNYIDSIIKTIVANPNADVITFDGYYVNGKQKQKFNISINNKICEKKDILYRKPNHLCPVKREIAIKCDFPLINYAEDTDYSDQICELIEVEEHINEDLYTYQFDLIESEASKFK